MQSFIIRMVILMALWAFLLYQTGTDQSISLLLSCAGVMTAYFFLPVIKKPLIIYTIIQLILLVLMVKTPIYQIPFIMLLLLFFAVQSIEHLTNKDFKLLSLFSFAGIAAIILLKDITSFYLIIFFLFFYILAARMNLLHTERKEQKELYEELLGEYRRLKRIVHATEQEARYEERTKIARDIHDSVGHKLTALLMQLEVLSIQNGNEQYKDLKSLAKESLNETRAAVKTLENDEQEGIASIIQLIKKLEAESHILIHFTTKQGILSAKLSNQQNIVLYRVIQEGLTNAMRHAHSRNVQVVLGRTAVGDIEFSISNKIYKQVSFEEGFGLRNMKERVKQLGGSLTVYQTETEFVVRGFFPE